MKPRKTNNFVKLCLALAIYAVSSAVTVTANEIRVGMSAALTGLNKDLGQQMKLGMELGFAEVNASGGVNGRKINLIALDDGYKPLLAAANMRTLIHEEKVLAVLGNTGTPTAVVTVPIANKNKTLMFGSYTGAGFLRDENSGCCIYNYRASYKQETAMMVKHILRSGIKADEIAFFGQNDSYGDAGFSGMIAGLNASGYVHTDRVVDTRYRRNTTNVEQAAADMLMLDKQPKAIIMVGSYGASSAFIKLLKPELPNVNFYNISFTGSEQLLKYLGKHAESVYITEVVPNVASSLPIAADYRAAFRNSLLTMEKPNSISFEGYIVARVFIEALLSIEGEVNRSSVLAAMENLRHPAQANSKAQDCFKKLPKQVSQTVWLNEIVNGKYKTIYVNNCE
jgi:ABC-type branched-subunit amino acid transport system substrate-binding protein